MPSYPNATKRRVAQQYWNAKHAPAIQALAEKQGCAVSTVRRWVRDYKPKYRTLHVGGGKPETKRVQESLKQFLAREKSQGPKAKAGKINYHYQRYENVYAYFFISLHNNKNFSQITCIPNVLLVGDGWAERTAMAFAPHSKEVHIPKTMKQGLRKCIKERCTKKGCNRKRFCYFMLILLPKTGTLTHANVVVVDTKFKTVERFEPHGRRSKAEDAAVNTMFREHALTEFGLDDYTYVPPTDLSPAMGVQKKADAYNGMCVTISMMYFQLRMLNPDVAGKEIVKDLMKLPSKDLQTLILRFAKFVEDTLRDNEDIIFKLRERLYQAVVKNVKSGGGNRDSTHQPIKLFLKHYNLFEKNRCNYTVQ